MNKDFHIGGSDYVNIKTSTVVKLKEDFTIMSEEGPITISVDIVADFVGIPQKYHEIFMNVLTSKYLNKVSYGDNQFSQCKPVSKRKWFQFWKSKYFTQQ